MKKKAIITIYIVLSLFVGYFASQLARRYPEPFKPSKMLRFKPVQKESSPDDVRIAQAELCRHGIPVAIDGKCGEETALGICELLCRIENGYIVYTIFERNPE